MSGSCTGLTITYERIAGDTKGTERTLIGFELSPASARRMHRLQRLSEIASTRSSQILGPDSAKTAPKPLSRIGVATEVSERIPFATEMVQPVRRKPEETDSPKGSDSVSRWRRAVESKVRKPVNPIVVAWPSGVNARLVAAFARPRRMINYGRAACCSELHLTKVALSFAWPIPSRLVLLGDQ